MSETQDKTHRLLFQFSRLVRDLIILCLGGEWTHRLDFSTLEQVPERLLSPELVRREQDVLWRVAYHPGDVPAPREPEPPRKRHLDELEDVEIVEMEPRYFYVYLHIEHQSRPRSFMALDMVAYKALVLQQLIRKGDVADHLPTILSVVFYDGEGAWNEATSLLELLQPISGLPENLNFWSYRLIDARRLDLATLIDSGSPLLGLFRLEQLEQVQDLDTAAKDLLATLKPGEEDLRRAFVTFINAGILPKLTPADGNPLRIDDLEEVPTMVAQRIENITQGWLKQGEKKGRLEMLQRQLELKFGDLPAQVIERLQSAEGDQSITWSERVLTASSLDEVFAD